LHTLPVWTGKPHPKITASQKNGKEGEMGAITVKYAGKPPTIYAESTTPPTNVGEYTVTADVAAGTGYKGTVALGDLKINGKPITTADFEYNYDFTNAVSVEWNDEEWEVEVTPKDNIDTAALGTITVSFEQSTTPVTPKAVGTYDVFLAVAEGKGYAALGSIKLGDFEITRIKHDLVATDFDFEPKYAEFNGGKKSVKINPNANIIESGLGTEEVKYDGSSGATTIQPAVAGRYKITVAYTTDGAGYKATTAPLDLGYFVIGAVPEDNDWSYTFAFKGKDVPYDGSPHGISVEKKNADIGDITVEYKDSKGNVTTGNAEIEGTQIWSSGGRLYIASSQSGEARIYNLTGTQVKVITLSAGETASEPLATGLYIITLNGKAQKIHVH
jgi:hypothetical protein